MVYLSKNQILVLTKSDGYINVSKNQNLHTHDLESFHQTHVFFIAF